MRTSCEDAASLEDKPVEEARRRGALRFSKRIKSPLSPSIPPGKISLEAIVAAASRGGRTQRSTKVLISVAFWAALILCLCAGLASCSIEKWTISIPGGADEADRVALEHECKNLGLLPGSQDVYLFEKRVLDSGAVHRTKRTLEAHPCVIWVDPQTPQERVKRDLISTAQQHRQAAAMAAAAASAAAASTNGGQQVMATGAGGGGGHHQMAVGPAAKSKAPPNHRLPLASSAQGAPVFKQQQQQQMAFDRGIYPSYSASSSSVAASSAAAAAAGIAKTSGASNSTGGAVENLRPFNDELWTHQWYLQDNSNVAQLASDIELRVEDVWKMGITGRGIVVTILDDGLEWNHTDILPNYDARASWDMNNNRSDPFPRYDSYDTNSHGTRCAGEVAMVANNRKCGVGVAPRARIGAIKCLDGEVADHIEYMSLLHNIDYIDIYSGSWGPSDNGQVVDGPKRLASQALERGVLFGRKGRGALYIWANGNGGALGDNCNCDGYVNSIYTISIGGVTQQGQIPFYGERCSSTLAVTCSSGAYTDRKIVTTDLHNKCTIDYTGTSAAAPLAAGVYALALEANVNLTWRDAQHLTVWTSNPIGLRDNPGWKRNAAGLMFNSRFGFGLLDAKAMVEAALKWQTVPVKSICSVAPSTRMPVFLQSRQMAQTVFISDGCQQRQQQHLVVYNNHHKQHTAQQRQQRQQKHTQFIGSANSATNSNNNHSNNNNNNAGGPVIYLEHVQLIIDLEYSSRGSLDIFLVSPAGTVSTLLSRRPLDVSRHGFDKWPLMSLHFWGESSLGKWVLIVRDKDGQHNRGLLRNATLVLHGTSAQPAHAHKKRIYAGEAEVQPFIDPVLEFDEDDIYDLNTFPNEMSLVRDDSFQPTFVKSMIAMEQSAAASKQQT